MVNVVVNPHSFFAVLGCIWYLNLNPESLSSLWEDLDNMAAERRDQFHGLLSSLPWNV